MWGLPLLGIAGVDVLVTVLQGQLQREGKSLHAAHLVFYYLNVCAWVYIGIVIVVFLVIKVGYLVAAWKFPRFFVQCCVH